LAQAMLAQVLTFSPPVPLAAATDLLGACLPCRIGTMTAHAAVPAVTLRAQRVRPSRLAPVILLAVAAVIALLASATAFAKVAKIKEGVDNTNMFKKSKMRVVLLKDHPKLGDKGDVVRVRKGYFRNYLLPSGVAGRQDNEVLKRLRMEEAAKDAAVAAAQREAIEAKTKIEGLGKLTFEKKVREGSNKIYGSLSATNFAEALIVKSGIPIRLASIELPKIAELGDFSATIDLGSDISAYVEFEVVPEGGKKDGEEGEGEEES